MNKLTKTWLLACSVLIATATSADTNDMVKQVKEWGSNLEHSLKDSENRNANLQKQLDKMSAQLKSTETERDSLKTELTDRKKALTVADKEAKSAAHRAEKAERQLAKMSDKANRKATKQEEKKMSGKDINVDSTKQKMSTNKVMKKEKMAEMIPEKATVSSKVQDVIAIPAVQTPMPVGGLGEYVAPGAEVMSDDVTPLPDDAKTDIEQ